MKGRSQRSDPVADEWGDGSWTVDCSCGVTFDDGEEMVSCDECGVWVHTRCARFVKGEPSFACHNCKATAAAAAADGYGDAEETEVAQLLAELPTKTGPASLPPLRRWAEVPLRDRVHVHGVPGGDPALFRGCTASVFTADLWRCTGYVPKKFSFQYREFPCWEEQEEEEDGQSNASRGANALFALSKEARPRVPSLISGMREGNDQPVVGWKKERSRRKDGPLEGKDRSGKKKASSEAKRRGSICTVDKKKSDICEDRDLQVGNSVPPDVKSEDMKREIYTESISTLPEVGAACYFFESNVARTISGEIPVKVEKAEVMMESVKSGLPPRSGAFSPDIAHGGSTESKMTLGMEQLKDEHHRLLGHNGNSGPRTAETEDLKPATIDTRGGQDLLDIPMCSNSDKIADRMERDNQFSSGETNIQPSSLSEEKLAGPDPQQDHGSVSGLLSIYEGRDRITDGVPFKSNEPQKQKQGTENSAGSLIVPKSSPEIRHASVSGNESPTFEAQNQANLRIDGPKPTFVIPKAPASLPFSSASGSLGSETSLAGRSVHLPKQLHGKVTSGAKSSDFVQESFREYSRKPVKCQLKGPLPSGQKPTQASKVPDSSSSKHRLSEAKQQMPHSGEVTSSYSRSKYVSSNSCQKGERIQQQDVPYNSKPIDLQVSEATTALSDEQLALLLHQQLNSSPRVPRVPRVRQTSGMQMAPPTATSVFSKRTSPFGGRDQVSFSKKKNIEVLTRESSRNAGELNDETRRFMAEKSARKDSGSRLIGHVTLTQQNLVTPSTEAASCTPSVEASESNISLMHRLFTDDPSDNICTNPRTLPGLIEEILSRNRHMTYEQLCDAVCPLWNDLRKPNGEKYAYPTHIHAVHDCLRNRSEWAHLIDQAPKTNSSKKRRKHDADTTPSIGSDKEKVKYKDQKEVEEKSAESIGEDFPKGKQKAWKRRRLEIQGRSVKDMRKRHSQSSASDDDPAALSHSSTEGNEALSSDGESEEGPPAFGAASASSSSSDAR